MKKFFVMFALFCTSAAARADSSPAQTGYCVQWAQQLVAQLQAPPVPDGQTPQWESDAFAAMNREEVAKLRPILEQWRRYVLSLLSMTPPTGAIELELARGKAQAKWDSEYIFSGKANAVLQECGTTSNAMACSSAKDPILSGIYRRIDVCWRGPDL